MTVEMGIQNDASFLIDEVSLRRAVETVIAQEQVQDAVALTVVFTTDEAVAALNQRFREINAPTDVLSFSADEPPVVLANEPRYLGDLVIAYPYAKVQAEREQHPLDESLALLVVHGVLHLLGYDHATIDEKIEMWAAQASVLEKLGISSLIVPALEEMGHAKTELD